MSQSYTQEDVEAAPAGHLPLAGTDLELVFTRSADDAIVHVNKGGILICRVRSQQAAAAMSAEALMQFSTVAPDFVFKVGDTRDGMERLKRSLGVV